MRTAQHRTPRMAAALTLSVLACPGTGGAAQEVPMATSDLRLESPAFAPGQTIPARYTCEGEDVSFPLAWSGVPEGTMSLALTIFDPDAPRPQGWVHWVVYDLPPDLRELAPGANLPPGAKVLENDSGKRRYGGPCPPKGHGVHHYHVTLFALDTAELPAPKDYRDLLEKVRPHTLAQAEVVGLYERKK